MKNIYIKNPSNLLWLLIISTAIIRLIIAGFTGLGIGEAYYARGAFDLQLSYFDQPPLFFWVSGIIVKLFGLSNFSLRIPAVLFFAGTTWLVYLSTKMLFDKWPAFWAAFTLNLSFVFTLPDAVWFQPDAPLLFFWMLSIYFLVKIFFSEKKEGEEKNKTSIYIQWISLGISVGLASLSKYHSIFLILGGVIFIIVNKKYRHWLTHPGLYLSAIIALLFLLPVFIWNNENHWVSFFFQGNRATPSSGFKLHPDWFIRNIIGQAIWVAPWIWYPLIKEFFRSFKLFKSDQRYSFFLCLAVLPIAFFTLITLWSNSQYHFHWQAPGYMVLFIPLGFTLAKKLKNDATIKRAKNWLIISSSLLIFIALILILQMNTGFLQTYGSGELIKKFGGRYDPTIEGYDFDQIHDRFEKEGWLNNDSLFVGTTHWWQTGKIDWALKGEKDVIIFSQDPRNYAFLSNPRNLLGMNGIVIRFNSSKPIEEFEPFFDDVTPLDDIIIARSDVEELKLQVYFCRNFKVPENYKGNIPLYRQLLGQHPFYISEK